MLQEKKACQICDACLWQDTIYLEKFDHGLFKERSISICLKCGFGQISPKIDKNELNDYYENIYRSKDSVMYYNFSDSRLNMEYLDYRSISQLLLGAQYMQTKEGYRFLDIGAGVGHSFVSARRILGNVKLFAIESNNDTVDFYKRHFNDISNYRHLSEVKEKMDVVLMSHALEHFDITDMEGLFHDIRGLLEDTGIVIIEVPNVDLRNAAMLNTRFNDTPHLSFFSLESMRKLADRSRFELCFINTVGQLSTVPFGPKKSTSVKRPVKDLIKRAAQYTGLYNCSYKIYAGLKGRNNFYDDLNFKYGGDRELIRCVLRMKTELK